MARGKDGARLSADFTLRNSRNRKKMWCRPIFRDFLYAQEFAESPEENFYNTSGAKMGPDQQKDNRQILFSSFKTFLF